MPTILVAGEAIIDFIPERPGPLADVESFTRRAGGAPANVAAALAALDEIPWFCTRLGSGPFGEFLADTLTECGIPDRFMTRDSNRSTALAFVSNETDADRSFRFYRDDTADIHLDTSIVPTETLTEVETIVVGGIALTVEPARTAIFDLVSRAQEHDCMIVFDPNVRPDLWDDKTVLRSVLDRMLSRADIVTASPTDFEHTAYPINDPVDLATTLLTSNGSLDSNNSDDTGPHTVFLTLGQDGALARATAAAPWNAGEWTHPGYTIEPVDTTGAGDAFTAGVLAALTMNNSIPETLAFANATAALTTTASGAMTALPTRTDVADFRDGQEK